MRRALFLLTFLGFLAGCAAEPPLQWAGIAEAYQYRDTSLVEVQLHAAYGVQPATERTATTGMNALLRIDDAVAEVQWRNGTVQSFPLTDWTTDANNLTMHAPLAVTGFDGFHMNATFVLRNGTTLRTHEGVQWAETYSRPWHANVKVVPQDGTSSIIMEIFEVKTGARSFEYIAGGSNNTMTPVRILGVDAWRLQVTLADGTMRNETAEPSLLGTTISVTLPYQGIAALDAFYTLRIDDGISLREFDVEGDVFPTSRAYAQVRAQEN